MVKDIIKRFLPKVTVKEKVDLHGFDYTVKELVQIYENSLKATEWHGSLLSNKILKYKNSDTIFILGSGPSINEITDEEWSYISNHDSIGFNFWFVHQFVPDYYLFQIPTEPDRYQSIIPLLKDKIDDYQKVPFIMRGSGFAKGLLWESDDIMNLLKNVPLYYLKEYPIASRCSINPNLLYKFFEGLGYMDYGHISRFVPKLGGTLGLLLILVYQMGYENIVLCGIDMQDNRHFWDEGSYTKIKSKYKLAGPESDSTNIKSHANKKIFGNTVPEYVYSLKEWYEDKNDIDMYVMKKKTVLYPQVPLF